MAGFLDTVKNFFSENIYDKDDGIKAGAILPIAAAAIGGFSSGGSILTIVLSLLAGLVASPLIGVIGKKFGWIDSTPKAAKISQVRSIEPFKTQEIELGDKSNPLKVSVSVPADPIPVPSDTINSALTVREQFSAKAYESEKLATEGAAVEAIKQADTELKQLKLEDTARFQSFANLAGGLQNYKDQYSTLLKQRSETVAQIAAASGLSTSMIEGRVPVPPKPPEESYKPNAELLARYALQYNNEHGVTAQDKGAFGTLTGFEQLAYALGKADDRVTSTRKSIDITLLPALPGKVDDIGGKLMEFGQRGRRAPENLEHVSFLPTTLGRMNNIAKDVIDRLALNPDTNTEVEYTFSSDTMEARKALREAASAGLEEIKGHRSADKESAKEYKNVLAYCDACDDRAAIKAEMQKLDQPLKELKEFAAGPLEKYRNDQTHFVAAVLPTLVNPAPARDVASLNAALAKNTAPLATGLHTDGKDHVDTAAPTTMAAAPAGKKTSPVPTNPDGGISTTGIGAGVAPHQG